MYNNKHELFEELEAFDIKWQMHFATIAKAAQAAKVLPLYADWLKSEDGVRYSRQMHGVPDRAAQEAAERQMWDRMQTVLVDAFVDSFESIADKAVDKYDSI
jgi:hypothetical protein